MVRLFLLSPARCDGARAQLLFRDTATFELARRLRRPEGAALGDVFTFLSGLYFRGKLAYARHFARPPAGLPGALVITPGFGLRVPEDPTGLERLRAYAEVPLETSEPRYVEPLLNDARALLAAAPPECELVLIGSVASDKYVAPLLPVFGARLLFPPAFVGRGDMSRGGLMLRCVETGMEMDYAKVAGARRRGARPARLPRRR
jgi:hypothetical protein